MKDQKRGKAINGWKDTLSLLPLSNPTVKMRFDQQGNLIKPKDYSDETWQLFLEPY
jgi:hypothetical protein